MNRDKRQRIWDAAEKLRANLNVKTPVDLDVLNEVVDFLGGRIEHGPAQHDATIRKEDDGFVIQLDKKAPVRRRIFSIAHELGHLFIHMGYGTKNWDKNIDYVESYSRRGYSEEEFEAHEFAGAFLMPAKTFGELFADGATIDEIAEHFGVSEDAALIRGRWLALYGW